MAGGTVPAGGTSYTSTTALATTAETTTFADRYGYISVVNSGSAPIYVRLDGGAATVGGVGSYVVLPNEGILVANALPLWDQSSKVIPAGTVQYPTGGGATTATPNGQPGNVRPFMSSLAGQQANPGTSVSVISASSGVGYTLAAAG